MEQIRLVFDSHFTHFFIRPQKKKWENENEKKKNGIEKEYCNGKLNCFLWTANVCVRVFFLFLSQQIRHRTKACQLKHWIINFGRKRSSNKSIFILFPLPKYLFYIYRDTTSGRFSLLQLIFFFFVCLLVCVCRVDAIFTMQHRWFCAISDIAYHSILAFTVPLLLHSLLYLLAVSFWFLAVFFSVFFSPYNRLRVSVLGYFAQIFFLSSSLMFLFVPVVAIHSERRQNTARSGQATKNRMCNGFDFRSPCHWKSLYGYIEHIWKLMTQ